MKRRRVFLGLLEGTWGLGSADFWHCVLCYSRTFSHLAPMMHRCPDCSQPTDSLSKGQIPSCDKTQVSKDSVAFTDNWRPCCIAETKTQTKQIFFSFPTYIHPPPKSANHFFFFQSHKRHKQVARRHEWSVPRWAHSLALVSDLSSIQVMTVGPLRPVLSWIWDIFSAMAMRGLSTAWKRRKRVCEQLTSVTRGPQG